MKNVCVIDECIVILCPEHGQSFFLAAQDADKPCLVMELEDEDVGYAKCAACEAMEKLDRIERRCH
jgi:hypothetical protein